MKKQLSLNAILLFGALGVLGNAGPMTPHGWAASPVELRSSESARTPVLVATAPPHRMPTVVVSPTTTPTLTPSPVPTPDIPGMKMPDNMSNMSDMPGVGTEMEMPSVTNVGDKMERESSGTAWVPDSSPVYGRMKMLDGRSMWMFMGTAFLRYKDVGSSRDLSAAGKGDQNRFDATSMFMAMYSHPIGSKGQLGFRSMVSLDPLIERGYGYPLLFQSGELFRGQPIHDRQHPHDLISELAVSYSYKISGTRSVYIYAGYPGEPALGPPMYLHRPSGANDPDAPIGHHWQDATHISFGVVTVGYSFGKAKLEASAFNGTEPNENRWNFDKPHLNSFSTRVSINPNASWALQISHAYLRDPEPSEPELHVLRRTTASAIYNKRLDDRRNFAGSIIWGQNYANRERTNSVLLEANYDFSKNALFGRFESVQKSGHELALDPPLQHKVFRVSALSIGYIRDIVQTKSLNIGVGAKYTADFNPQSLSTVYGGISHSGWQLFLRFRLPRLGH